ncbi:uncharacterized protein DEA37_0009003 [Paragonimus westermani]|uniref:Integrase catalytic domain-containing protein n=1 Tax=Paragonimus westermani TaxID=34504 RepID=A0A5J4NFZ5_9TREM|nr:uncharacterized protein DEA37_0009003 [Paragonimus westermani]
MESTFKLVRAAMDIKSAFAHSSKLPVPEDLFTKPNGGQSFAKVDLADAYLQIPVEEKSRKLLTINNHRGLFQYTRLPFGIKTTPATFQQIMDTMLSDYPGCVAYLDVIIIMGRDAAYLVQKLARKQPEEYGFRLRKEKCIFMLHIVEYLGFITDKHGRHPDPASVEAIKAMPPPKDVSGLRSFLGLVSYYGAFLPTLHQLRGSLNRLLTKDSKWEWTTECPRSFEKVKAMITSDLHLTHFNPSLPIEVASDASNFGIGAVISNVFPDGSEKSIAHAARSLTPTEKNYSQIEKEALSIIFAVKKFHKMLYGRRFTLLTDHKPLLTIFGSKKGIPVYTANRLQRWATMLLAYDFNIQYRNTHEFGKADALSRLINSKPIDYQPCSLTARYKKPFCSNSKQTESDDSVIESVTVEREVRQVLFDNIRALPVTATTIKNLTNHNEVLQKVMHNVRTRWNQHNLYSNIRQFFHRRDSLSIVDGCLLFGERVVVPRVLRDKLLNQFHTGHPSINRMKALARSYVYWSQMDSEIERFCQRCEECQLAAKAPPKCPWQPRPDAEKPWQRLHLDFAVPVNGQNYMILVDAFKWPEVVPMTNPNSISLISELNKLFSYFGIPETIVSDNGSQFTSATFQTFCEHHGIQQKFSPPYHPQSNGQAGIT